MSGEYPNRLRGMKLNELKLMDRFGCELGGLVGVVWGLWIPSRIAL